MTRLASPRLLVARIAITVAAALLAAACSTSPAPSGAPSSAYPVSPASLSYTLPDDPIRMAFPTTGAETRWTQGLDAFGQQVTRFVADSCARDAEIGLPEQTPPAFIRFSDVPDLDFLARHGFGYSAEIPTPEVSSALSHPGGPATIRRCNNKGAVAANAIRDTYVPLQRQWFRELATLRRDTATIQALRTLPDCLTEQGFRVRSEDDFFRIVDSRLQAAAPADFPRVDRELGHAYATCMRPVEAVREPARQQLLARFLAGHTDQIRELRKTLVPSLHRAEKRYGLRLVFPAP